MFLDKKQVISLKYKISLHENHLTKYRSKIKLKKPLFLKILCKIFLHIQYVTIINIYTVIKRHFCVNNTV